MTATTTIARRIIDPRDTDRIVIREGHARVETCAKRVKRCVLGFAGVSDGAVALAVEMGGLTTAEVFDALERRRGQTDDDGG